VAGVVAALAYTTPSQASSTGGQQPTHSGGGQVKYYIVQPPGQDGADTLAGIARRTLGDADRFPDIFALNVGRVEPDGRTVSDPMDLHPGWVLQLPPDAAGPGVQVGDLNAMGAGTPAASQQPSSAVGSPGRPVASQAPTRTVLTAARSATPVATVRIGAATVLVLVALGAALLLRRLRRRTPAGRPTQGPDHSRRHVGTEAPPGGQQWRGHQPTQTLPRLAPADPDAQYQGPRHRSRLLSIASMPVPIEAPLFRAPNPSLPSPAPEQSGRIRHLHAVRPVTSVAAALSGTDESVRATPEMSTVDHALRVLAEACESAGRAQPQPYVVALQGEDVLLRFSPPEAGPPAPWISADEGSTWRISVAGLEGLPASSVAPYPSLVQIRSDRNEWLALNLDRAFGIVALTGDEQRSRRLAEDFAVQLTTNPWARGNRGTVVGMPVPAAADGGTARLDHVDSLIAFFHKDDSREDTMEIPVVDGAEGAAPSVQRDATSVIVLRGRRPGDQVHRGERGEFVIVGGAPSPQDASRLAALAHDGRTPRTVVVVGETAIARWRCEVRRDGGISIGVLGVDVPGPRS
jgi:hypothetical protein